MNSLIKFLLLTLVVLLGTCFTGSGVTNQVDEVDANNQFTMNLFNQLARKPGNFVFSPYSVENGLGMTLAGANGKTAEQICGALDISRENVTNAQSEFTAFLRGLRRSGMDGNQLYLANALWVQKGLSLLQSYQDTLQVDYDAKLNVLDLNGWPGPFDPQKSSAARQVINDWVKSQTQGKIDEALPARLPDSSTRLILINAIYFKGIWETPFNKLLTTNSPFYYDDRKTNLVPMMVTQGRFKFSKNYGCSLLEIPYSSNRFSMVIFLPDHADGLPNLEKSLNLHLINDLYDKSYFQTTYLYLPKFQITSEFDLAGPFEALGVTDAFSEASADFSRMASTNSFFIKAAMHKVYLSVDKDGTAAAAETSILLANGIISYFVVDHPFVFLIRDNPTGAILFMGRVVNPF